jgi:hypothetical protein
MLAISSRSSCASGSASTASGRSLHGGIARKNCGSAPVTARHRSGERLIAWHDQYQLLRPTVISRKAAVPEHWVPLCLAREAIEAMIR